MKKLYSLIVIMMVTVVGWSQTTYTWQGADGASWAVSTNWNPTRTTPAVTDILQFNDGNTKLVTGVPTQTINRLFVSGNTIITLEGGGTLTVGGTAVTDLQIDAGSQLVLSAANLTMAGAGSVAGTLTVSSGRTFDSDNAGVVTTVTGSVDNAGSVLGTAARLLFSANSNYFHSQNGGAVPTAGWNAASTVSVTSVTTTAPTALNQAFGNFTWNSGSQTANLNTAGTLNDVNGLLLILNTGSGSLAYVSTQNTAANYTTLQVDGGSFIFSSGTGGPTVTVGSVTLNGGSLTMAQSTGVPNMNVGGNWTNNGAAFTASGTITFNGAAQSIGGSSSTSFNNLTIAGATVSTTTLGINTTIAGNLNVTTGDVLILGTYTANRSTAGGTLTVAGTMTLAGTSGGRTGSNFPDNFGTNTLSGTVNYDNASGGQTIYGATYGTLTLGNTSGTQTAGGNLVATTVNNNGSANVVLDMTTFTLTGTSTVNNTGLIRTQSAAATPLTSGEVWGGTVEYDGAAQTVIAGTYNNLSMAGSGNKTVSGVIVVNGTLTIPASINFIVGGSNFTANGLTDVSGTLTSSSTTGAKTFDDLVINSGGSFNSTVAEAYAMTGSLTVNGSLTSGAGTWTFSGTGTPTISGTATITNAVIASAYINSGNFTFTDLDVNGTGAYSFTNNGTVNIVTFLTGNDTFLQGATGVLNFAGASIGGTLNAAAAGNIVNYTAAAQAVEPGTYSNLYLSGSLAKTLAGNITVNATLSMRGTAALALATFTLTYGAASTLEYAGSTAQTSTNTEFKTPGGPLNLTINNAAGVTLHAARAIGGTLSLSSGILNTTTTNLLTLNAGATSTASSDASFVNGPLRKAFNAAESFTFPIGVNGTGDEPLIISGVTAAGYDFTAEYKRTSATSLDPDVTAPVINVSGCDHWTLAKNAGPAAGVSVTLTWDANSSCGSAPFVTNPSTLTVASLQGGSWQEAGVSGTFSASSVTRNDVTTFDLMSLANTAIGDNALPVMFADVKAFEKNAGVQIEWSNLTERDLIKYVVERSANGRDFAELSQHMPRSNRDDKESYSSFDVSPNAGVNYYRIKVLEISGKIIYSKVMRVDLGASSLSFSVYPNPVKGNVVSVGMNAKQGQYTISVHNTAGQQIYSQRLSHLGGSMNQVVELPANITPGVYNMVIAGDQFRQAKMFIVQ